VHLSAKFLKPALLISVFLLFYEANPAAAKIFHNNATSPSFRYVTDEYRHFEKCWSLDISPNAQFVLDQSQLIYNSGPSDITAVNSPDGKRLWVAELGGKLVSNLSFNSRAVFAVFAISGSPGQAQNDSVSRLYAIDRSSGLVLWRIEIKTSPAFYLSSNETSVFIIGQDMLFRINSADGAIVWQRPLDFTPSAPAKLNSSLIGLNGQNKFEIYSQSEGKLVKSFVSASPATAFALNHTVYFGDSLGKLYSFDPESTEPDWAFVAGGKFTALVPLEGAVLAGSADNFLYKISSTYGSLYWKLRLAGRIAEAALLDDELAIVSVIGERPIFLIDLKKGKIFDQLQPEPNEEFINGKFVASGRSIAALTSRGLSFFKADCNKTAKSIAPLKN
jgi:outer membrane protein assembly factor BamB